MSGLRRGLAELLGVQVVVHAFCGGVPFVSKSSVRASCGSTCHAAREDRSSDNLRYLADDLISDSGTWKVFICYSWDSEERKAWVLAFANRLCGDGIDTILDQTHLNLGGRTPEFMERSIRDSRSVLVVCTEGYKQRFDGAQRRSRI